MPSKVTPDNLKSGVTKAHRDEPDVNATYQDMTSHYATVVVPARPYKPRDLAKVEAGVQLAERWIIARLRRTPFTSLGALNEVILELVEVINLQPFKNIEGTRRSLVEEIDKPALIPLPLTRYEFATWRQARINIDYHLKIDHHYYSVPHTLARNVVDVRVTSTVIEVFVTGRHVTDPAHMPDSHRRYLEWTPGRVLAWANTTGPTTGAFISELLTRRPLREQGFRSARGAAPRQKLRE